jgi:hypothetical protein
LIYLLLNAQSATKIRGPFRVNVSTVPGKQLFDGEFYQYAVTGTEQPLQVEQPGLVEIRDLGEVARRCSNST